MSHEIAPPERGVLWVFGGRDALRTGANSLSTIIETAVDGEPLQVIDIKKDQKYTKPPARYLEAGLIKVLEEKGIGRPSTYAVIIDTLFTRRYVEFAEEDKRLIPTKLGLLVNKFLIKYFSDFINEDFTAEMEESLDEIAEGKLKWQKMLGQILK